MIAALVLAVGVLAAAGSVAGAARDANRARAVDAAVEALAARGAVWRAAPCVAGGGERALGAGRERWAVHVAGGVGVLADTVEVGGPAPTPRVGVVAVAWCGP